MYVCADVNAARCVLSINLGEQFIYDATRDPEFHFVVVAVWVPSGYDDVAAAAAVAADAVGRRRAEPVVLCKVLLQPELKRSVIEDRGYT